jgi:hypothetical protein
MSTIDIMVITTKSTINMKNHSIEIINSLIIKNTIDMI